MIIINIDSIIDSISYLSDDENVVQRAATLSALWIDDHISDESLEGTDKALNLAEALGRYYVRALEFDSRSSLRVGDITVGNNAARLLDIEKKLRDEAIACAADILKDGDFYFASC